MRAFLMTWSPAGGWPHEELKKLITNLSVNPEVAWRIQAHKQAEIGDRVYFYKQGIGQVGVFGVGNIASEPFQSLMPGDLNPRMRVNIHIEKMVDPLEQLLISAVEVHDILPINARASGVRVTDGGISRIEELLNGEPLTIESGRFALPAWSFEELEAAVDAYLQMMTFEKHNQPYSKTDIRMKALAEGLKSRSPSAFEFRMRNISAVIVDLGLKPVKGYLAASNMGKNREVIEAILSSRLRLDVKVVVPTANDEQLNAKVELLLKTGIVLRPKGVMQPAIIESRAQQVFSRSALVKAWVLQESTGICEGCESPAPFQLSTGQPFLEVHHVKPLAQGGPDIVENAVALCPNCHRRCHLSIDRDNFTDNLYTRIPRLIRL